MNDTATESPVDQIEEALEQEEVEAMLATDPEGSDLSTDPITDNSDGLDDKLSDDAVIGSIGKAVETPVEQPAEKKPITIDHDAEVKMLRQHDQELRELAEEHQELESEWETAKLQAKGAKDRLDECALRLRNAALRRPTFGPLFDKPADEPAAAPVVAQAEVTDEPAANAWRDMPLKGTVSEEVAKSCEGLDLITYGNVYELLDINADEDLIADLASVGVSEDDAKALIAKTHELAGPPAEEKAEEKPVDPDYWKAAEIVELDIPKSLATKLNELDIFTLDDLSQAVKACGHEGYRGIEGIGPKKAELLEDAWQKWFAAHPAPAAV